MDKKGAIFHWIIVGALVAFGIFFIYFSQVDLAQQVKGQWQINFLEKVYLPAQKEELRIEVQAREIGREVERELALKGGFLESSPCGVLHEENSDAIKDINVWNTKERFCFPNYQANAVVLAQKGLKEKLGEYSYSLVQFLGQKFVGKGEKKPFTKGNATYFYDSSFGVNTGFDMGRYDTLREEAKFLLVKCQNEEALIDCVQKNLPAEWKLGKCGGEWEGGGRRLPFCISVVAINGASNSNLEPLQYQLGLDFESTSVRSVSGVEVIRTEKGAEVTFNPVSSADSYKIYFSDDLTRAGKVGTVGEVFGGVASFNFVEQKVLLVRDTILSEEACRDIELRLGGKGYFCPSKIIYVLWDERLLEGEHTFSVTAVKSGEESDVLEVVKK